MTGKVIRIATLLLLLFTTAKAQQSSLALKTAVNKHRVRIRLAPATPETWKQVQQTGLLVQRIEWRFSREPLAADFATAQTIATLVPLPATDTSAWRKQVAQNPNAALAYDALYNHPAGKLPPKQKEKNEQLLFGLVLLSADLDVQLAQALGLLLNDSTAEQKVYAYRFQPAKAIPGFAPAVAVVDAREETTDPDITSLAGTFGDKTVKLSWTVSQEFAGYHIERSDDSVHFTRVDKAPVVHLWSQHEQQKNTLTFNDTFPENKRRYWYRVRGITCFGASEKTSNTVHGSGNAALQNVPVIDSIRTEANTRVVLHWHCADQPGTVRTQLLLRAAKEAGPYQALAELRAGAGSYTDEKPLRSNYYKIAAIGFGNDTLVSFSAHAMTYDETPPAVPAHLAATVSEKGIVQLNWDAGSEQDLLGYRVSRSNSPGEEFVEISRVIVPKNSFTDTLTLHTLTPDAYYRVQAVDRSYNNSQPCAPVRVLRPDTIAPVAPLIRGLQGTAHGITMRFIPSSSSDVQRYELWRAAEGKNDSLLRHWDAADTLRMFTDSLVEQGRGYYYHLLVSDRAGNKTVSNRPYLFYETGSRKAITSLVGTTDRSTHTIRLEWSCEEKSVFRYVIYRSKKGEPLRILRTLPPGETTYTDRELHIGNTYVYRIKAILQSGVETELGEPVEVEY